MAAVVLAAALHVAQARAAAIVIDHGSGAVLHEDQADLRWRPASLTKMMTLHLIFDALAQRRITLATRWRVSRHAAGQPAMRLNLQEGATISVHDAILALVTRSANDVAVVAAEALGRSEAAFARMMTRRARSLGMQRTVFRNASGLPDPAQVTTARDMAALARALIRNHQNFYHFFAVQDFEYGGRVLTSHNRLLERYSGADGLKTGYIRASGFNLATSALRDGRRLVAVVLGGESPRARDDQMVELLDRGFAFANALPATQLAARPAEPARDDSEWDFDADPTPSAARVRPMPGNATQVALRVRPADPVWGVQVGAFSDRAAGRRAADRAARLLAPSVGRFAVELTPTAAPQRSYRVRLGRMNQSQAREACRVLRAQRMECATVSPADLRTATRVAAR